MTRFLLPTLMYVLLVLPASAIAGDDHSDPPQTPDPTPTPSPLEYEAADPNMDFDAFLQWQVSLEAQVGLQLFEEHDDYRAIGALKRYRILDGGQDAFYLSSLVIGEIYHRNDRPRMAIMSFEEALRHAPDSQAQAWTYLLGVQQVCLGLGMFWECHRRLEGMSEAALTDEVREVLDYQRLFIDLILGHDGVTSGRAQRLRDPRLQERALKLVLEKDIFENLPLKKPALSGTLSLLPGLGQLYNGRPVDAAAAFLMTGIFATAALYSWFALSSLPLTIVAGAIGLGFYAGNIVNAVVDARRINAQRYQNYFEGLTSQFWPRLHFQIDDASVDYRFDFDWPGPVRR